MNHQEHGPSPQDLSGRDSGSKVGITDLNVVLPAADTEECSISIPKIGRNIWYRKGGRPELSRLAGTG